MFTATAFGVKVDIDLALMVKQQEVAHFYMSSFQAIHELLQMVQPKILVVQGDTTTVLAGAMAAVHLKIPVAHVEAGLRTFNLDRPFPEEINRRLVDAVASFYFAPTHLSAYNLLHEGVCKGKLWVTGNTVVDALQWRLGQPPPPGKDKKLRFLGFLPLI